MKMKKVYFILLLAFLLSPALKAADGDLFPYPKVPEEIVNLNERCDFLVSRFWAPCDFKSAMSKKDKFRDTFSNWISFMPYATADTVHMAIDRLLKKAEKNGPLTLELGRMAEQFVYSDSADFISEEIYYPFAMAVAANKKISDSDKLRFRHQAQIIDNSRVHGIVKHLNYVTPDGKKGSIDNVHTQMIVLLFNDHDCDNCALARIRLAADVNATALINAGMLTVMCIEPGEAGEEWKSAAATFPSEWIVGASEDADEYFSLPTSPTIYLLDSRHKVLYKEIRLDGLLAALRKQRIDSGI